MQTTAETIPMIPMIDDEERTRRRAARIRLKAEVNKPGMCGYTATILYMIISHTRGKLHCQSYCMYHSGWRAKNSATATYAKAESMRERGRFGEDDEDFQRYCKRVGPGCKRQWAELYYASSIVEDLDDQHAFLRLFLDEEGKRAERLKEVIAQSRREPQRGHSAEPARALLVGAADVRRRAARDLPARHS